MKGSRNGSVTNIITRDKNALRSRVENHNLQRALQERLLGLYLDFEQC